MRYSVHRVHSAYCYRCPVGLKRESCHIECVQQLEELLEERGAQIAAVIVEPLLQGAGGMIVHPVEFLQKVRALCTEARCAADCRRGADGIRTDRKNVCLRSGKRHAGFDVRLERNHRRISSHGSHALQRSRGICVPQRESLAHFLSRAFLHGKRAGLRRRQCESADFRRRAGFRSHRDDRANSCDAAEASTRHAPSWRDAADRHNWHRGIAGG